MSALTPLTKRLTPGVTYLLSSQAVTGARIIASLATYRLLAPDLVGIWQSALLVQPYLSFIRLGVINGFNREYPYLLGNKRKATASLIAESASAYTVACALFSVLVFIPGTIYFWSRGVEWRIAFPAVGVVVATGFVLDFVLATYRVTIAFSTLARIQLLQAVLALSLPVAVFFAGFTGYCLQRSLQAVVLLIVAFTFSPLKPKHRFSWRGLRLLFGTGLPLFASNYAQMIATSFDRVVLLHVTDTRTLGLFDPVLLVVATSSAIPAAVGSYFYPRMCKLFGQTHHGDAVFRLGLRASLLSFLVTLPVVALGWWLIPWFLVRWLPRYAAVGDLARYALFTGSFLGASRPLVSVMSAMKAWRFLYGFLGALVVARLLGPALGTHFLPPLFGVALGSMFAGLVVYAASAAFAWRSSLTPPDTPQEG